MFLYKRNGIYYLHYYDEIGNRKRRISTKTRLKTEALKFLTVFKEKLKEQNKIRYISLSDFKTEYLQLIDQIRSKSYLTDVKSSFSVLISYTGDIPLTKLNSRMLEKMLLEIHNRTNYGAKHHYNNLRAAFNKAITWDYLDENPLAKVKLPKIPKSFPAFINKDELELIIKNTPIKDLQDFFLMSFHTGMHRDEIRLLKWSAVNLKEQTIIVQNTDSFTTKNKKERVIPINDTLLKMLLNRVPRIIELHNNEYVIHRLPGVPYHKDYVTKQFKKVVRSLGMNENIRLHSLRHSAASVMVQNNVSLLVVKEILGHEDLSTTQIYSHLQKENLTQAVKVLDQAL